MTRQALADAMGVSTTAVYKWENGMAQPSIPMLQKLADLFGVTLDNLCGYVPREREDGSVENIAVMTRAFRRLTPKEQEQYIALGRVLFERAFDEREQT